MMLELGKYAFAVLASYGVTLALLVMVVVFSVLVGWRVKRALAEVERRQGKDNV